MEWPLIGRDAILRRLIGTLDGSTASTIVIWGQEGVGKTRLASELGRTAAERGRTVDRVWASPSAGAIPFGAVAHLLALPSRTPDLSALMGALLAELRRRSGAAGTPILVVDDAQHLDDHSAAFVHQAAAQQVASVVLTMRAGEPVPSALTLLWKDRGAERVDVGPLSRDATRQLAEAVLGGPLDALTASELWQRSLGNPLYLRELILGGLEAGALVHDAGQWRAAQPMSPSSRLSELVRSRLATLSVPEAALVESLAVAHELDLRVLEQIAHPSALEDLEERHLVVIEQSGNRTTVRLAHPIYGEVVAADMPRTRARRTMRRLADLLEQTGARRSDDLLRLALWRVDGGGGGRPELLVAAARKALAAFDATLAERLARAALGGGGPTVEADLVLGEALAAQQRIDDADDALSRAQLHARSDDQIAKIAIARANLLYFRAGRIEEAVALLSRAAGQIDDVDWRDEVDSLLVLFRAAAGQLRSVASAGRRVLERVDARPRAVVHVLTYASIANVMLGRFAEAEEQVDAGLGLAEAVAHELPLNIEMLRINGVMAHAYAGRDRRAAELWADGYRAALDTGVPEVASMWGMNVAECQLLKGDLEASLHTMLGALAIARERDPFSVHGIDAAVASVCASWLGRHELARELRQEIVELELARDVRSRIWLDRATVWTTWAESGGQASALAALEAARRAVTDTHLVWGAWLYHDAVRLGHAEPAATSLASLATRIEGGLVAAMAGQARALADSDAVGLERAASAFEQLGSYLFAAEAAAQAQQVYLRRDRQQLARLAAARAAILAARCPGARTPPLADAAEFPLTARELEIARLAAAGLSSRDVAERLQISTRTVDNHLGTIYSKLGVAGRAGLPAVLGVGAGPE